MNLSPTSLEHHTPLRVIHIVSPQQQQHQFNEDCRDLYLHPTVIAERLGYDDKPEVAPHNSRKTIGLRVSFDLSQTVEHDPPKLSTEEVDELWYNKKEYKKMKQNCLQLGRKFQAHDRTTMDDPYSFKAVLCKTFTACRNAGEDPRSCLLDKCDEAFLRKWLSKGNRLGVEQLSVMTIAADRMARRKRLAASVMEAQERFIHVNADERATYICQVAQEISRPSRLFAWRLAYKQVSKSLHYEPPSP